jgi:V8-like Glu-specific endopeptidase
MKRVIVAAVALATVATVFQVSAASARPADDPRFVGGPVTPAHTVNSVSTYWTPTRMAHARPAVLQISGSRVTAPAPEPPGQSGGDPPSGSTLSNGDTGASLLAAVAVPKPYNTPPDRLNGKVFFTKMYQGIPVADYVCSGTVINAPGRSLVWTAGHCIHGGPGYDGHANWMFIPAYSSNYNGEQPYGQFHAIGLWTTAGWANSGNMSYDVGLAIVGRNSKGKRLSEATSGGQGLWFGVSSYQNWSAFGYPAAAPFIGWDQYRCNSGTTGFDNPPGAGPNTTEINCDMTGGSSGGGWLINMDHDGWGYVNSVVSYRYNDDDVMYGPYHGATALALYQFHRNTAAP